MITKKEILIFELLNNGGCYGLDLVRKSNGKLKRGTVYVTLYRMEQHGLIESFLEDRRKGEAGISRRTYMITAFGQSYWASSKEHQMVASGRG